MDKRKISSSQKKYSVSMPKKKKEFILRPEKKHLLKECNPTEEICDGTLIKEAIWECLKDNDPEGVVEVIEIYLETMNKVKATKENKLARSTMYNTLKSKNPTIKTLCKLIHCCM